MAGCILKVSLGLFALLLSLSIGVYANDATSAAEQLRRIQQEQQQRQQQQFENDLKSAKPAPRMELAIPETIPLVEGEACQQVESITVEGVTLFSEAAILKIINPYEGRCLGVNDIQNVMTEVTAKYLLAGYLTTRVYLAAQDLSSGVLQLLVLEGYLEGVQVDEVRPGSVALYNVFPGKAGAPLNLRDIEQALENMNRLQSNNATMTVAPGEAVGGSVVTFHNQASRAWRASLSYDNSGVKSTGEEQAGLTVSADSPFLWNDFLSFTARQTTPYDRNDIGSRLLSLSYSVPFGYSRLSFNAADSKYYSPLKLPSGLRQQSSGESNNASLRFDHTAFRDRDSRWDLAATLTGRESKSYLEKQLIEVSSRRLTVLDIDSTYRFLVAGGAASVNLGYSKGLDALGALDDPSGLPGFAPHAQFSKWRFGASYSRSFAFGTRVIAVSSQLMGQYANDVLYGSEMLLIGGLYTVRGFSENSLSGDNGYYLRNDLSMPMTLSVSNDWPLLIKPYVGLDYGRVKGRNSIAPKGDISGAAAGVTLASRGFNADVFASRAISKPGSFNGEGTLVSFRVGYTF